MPISTMLPKGCSSVRGSSLAPKISSVGGHLARHANRFYMLNVRRESLIKKKASLENRLGDIKAQLKQIDADIRATQGHYNRLSRKEGRASGDGKKRPRAMCLTY